jgi:raffinose/stachyose/melibiose transport system permease protein
MKAKRYRKMSIGMVVAILLLILLAMLIIIPLIWLILTSFKTNKELFLDPWHLPQGWLFSNYSAAWHAGVGKYFFNSLVVTGSATLVSTLLSCMAAYALSRIQFRGQNFFLLFIVAGLMLTPQSSLISLFEMSRAMGIYNTRLGVAIVNAAFRIPFSTFLIRSWFLTISHEIEESATIDGCNTLGIFFRIILPVSKPIIGSSIIVCVRAVWNDLMFSLVLLENDSLKTIPVGLVNMKSFTTTNWTVLIAGMIIASIPLVALFLVLQKQFVRGLSAGSVKG